MRHHPFHRLSKGLRGLLILGLWWLGVSAGQAQDSALKLSLRREWEGARSSAPLGLRATVRWQDSQLLEGRLRVGVYRESTPIGLWTGPETALVDGEQSFSFMIPRPILEYDSQKLVFNTEFLSSQRTIPSEELDVAVAEYSRRDMVVAAVVRQPGDIPTGLASSDESLDHSARTAYEQPFLLQQRLSERDVAALYVHMTRVVPVDLPTDPLRYLGLDGLVLAHDVLNLLKDAQREALRTWVLAGGNLVLIQTGPLEATADRFVRDLSQNGDSFMQRRDPLWPAGMTQYSPGLGQFFHGTQAIDGKSRGWQKVAWALLRVQDKTLRSLNAGKDVELPRVTQNDYRWRNFDDIKPVRDSQPLGPQSRIQVEDLTYLLLPREIRGMPLGLAAAVLAGCLFCIGPGDYFLLGLIKRRRWTWVFFPLVTLGFTGWMAQLAAEHNGRNDSRTWISIVDITPENEVLRTSRIELNYGATTRLTPHSVQGQWWTDLRQDDLGWKSVSADPYRAAAYDEPSRPDLGPRMSYEGGVPTSYTVHEPVRQWTPRLQRITTLGADPALSGYPLPRMDWNALRQAKVKELAEGLSTIAGDSAPPRKWLFRRGSVDSQWMGEDLPTSDARLVGILEIIHRLTIPDLSTPGIHSILSELAPTGGPDCEDLCLRSRHSLLLLQEVEPGRYLVTRVVYPPSP